MASSEREPSLSLGVETLRETFGDPKLPDITRKITACVACRKQKIKCHKRDAEQPCTRCKARGLPCTVNRSLQMLLEGDAVWKANIGRQVKRLSAALGLVAKKLSMPELIALLEEDRLVSSTTTRSQSPRPSMSQMAAVNEDENHQASWSRPTDAEFTPASIPADCVPNVTNQSAASIFPISARLEPDIVACGIISLEKAKELFGIYYNRLDHYVYRILGDIEDLSTIRERSPLLMAAICTVASLHHSSQDIAYDRCFQEFVRLGAARMFSGRNNLEDIMAFVIGAFWLPEVSWVLIGAAVRISTELQLHRSILGINDGKRETYLRARLYYFVYICDHHFSIPYGRPPLTGEYEAVRLTDRFLKSVHAVKDDERLISQIDIWSITSQVFQTFGTDSSQPVPVEMVRQLRRYNIALDTWRADWMERSWGLHNHVGNYPEKGVGMHCHFAKLYLCAHSFRGISQSSTASYHMPQEMVEIAEMAVASATYILRTVNTDSELQSHLNGLPLYFDTMIAFTAVFLLKISTEYSNKIPIDTAEALSLVRHSVSVLEGVGSKMKSKHLLIRIGQGLRMMVERYKTSTVQEPAHPGNLNTASLNFIPPDMRLASNIPEDSGHLSQDNFAGFGLECFDLLEPSTHNMYSSFDPWLQNGMEQNGFTPWQSGSV